jgi:hypothetical protein
MERNAPHRTATQRTAPQRNATQRTHNSKSKESRWRGAFVKELVESELKTPKEALELYLAVVGWVVNLFTFRLHQFLYVSSPSFPNVPFASFGYL